jgi:fatty acid desaturase
MSDHKPPAGPPDDASPEPTRGSESLRSLGTAWIVVGVLGLLALLVAYLVTDLSEVWVAVPLLLVFLMLGGVWFVQGRRRTPRG